MQQLRASRSIPLTLNKNTKCPSDHANNPQKLYKFNYAFGRSLTVHICTYLWGLKSSIWLIFISEPLAWKRCSCSWYFSGLILMVVNKPHLCNIWFIFANEPLAWNRDTIFGDELGIQDIRVQRNWLWHMHQSLERWLWGDMPCPSLHVCCWSNSRITTSKHILDHIQPNDMEEEMSKEAQQIGIMEPSPNSPIYLRQTIFHTKH